MRCPRCEFENMPGQDRCFKCGSILQPEKAAAFYPPRMAGWKRPLRKMVRQLRTVSLFPDWHLRIPLPRWLTKFAQDEFLSIVLSVIPGLAHALDNRFREIRWYCLGWGLLILASVFFYGSNLGLFSLSFAVGLHGYIAYHASLKGTFSGFRQRVLAVGAICVYIALLYWAVRTTLFHDFTGAHTALNIPFQNINTGDYLLSRRSLAREDLRRGALVQFRPAIRGNHYYRDPGGAEMIGEVIGLPGDTVEIKKGSFWINGQPADAEIFPVPHWLRNREIQCIISPNSYFISSEYTINIYGGAGGLDGMITNVCVVPAQEITARAVMRWIPLGKRGFIKDVE